MNAPPIHLFVLALLSGLLGQALDFTSFQFCYLIALYAAGLLVIARPVALLALALWAAGWGAPAAAAVFIVRLFLEKSTSRSGYFPGAAEA